MTRQVRLCLNLQATGRHDAAWKTLPPTSDWIAGIDYYTQIARLAERARFDAIFIADRLGSLDAASYRRPWRGTDPTVLLAALARETTHIGLVSTNPAIHGHPFLLARTIATLDHVSQGRAGWNIITSQEDVTRAALGIDEILEPETRYRKAEEFIAAVNALWASLPEEAVVADAAADTYIDARRTRPADVAGEFYRTSGVLPLPGGYQGRRPVLFQAGASRRSKELGARWADALFTSQRLPELSREFSAEVKGLAVANGRQADDLLVLPGLFTILGPTEAAARERKRELDEQLAVGPLLELLAAQLEFDVSRLDLDAELPYADLAARVATPAVTARRDQLIAEARRRRLTVRQLLFHNLSGGQRTIVGTPEQVADDIVEWVDTGASDGFVINIDVQPAGFVEFIDGVVTELQDRGRFRREYAHDTLRGNLGLSGAAPGGAVAGGAVAGGAVAGGAGARAGGTVAGQPGSRRSGPRRGTAVAAMPPTTPGQRGLSLFLTIPTDGEPVRSYRESLDAVRLAEELGYETVWAAEGHFSRLGLPSALAFLAAASQLTTTVRLGTAVVPLAFDNPIRLAETAAVVDALSDGRVELGVGKSNGGGFSTLAFEAFALSEEDRETLYTHALRDLRQALGGTVIASGREASLYPPPAGLLPRLWQATGNSRTAAETGRAGDGLLLHRLTPSGDAGQIQSGLIDDYLGAYTGERGPRIGISRALLPASSRRDAISLIESGLRSDPDQYVTLGGPPRTAEEFLASGNVKYGDPDDIVEQLLADEAFTRSTDYLFSISLPHSAPQFRDGLALIAQEIFPRLPALAREPAA